MLGSALSKSRLGVFLITVLLGFSISTVAQPQVPPNVNRVPANESTGVRMASNFSWLNPPGSHTHYSVRVIKSLPTPTLVGMASVVSTDTVGNVTTLSLNWFNLEPNTTYSWQVRSEDRSVLPVQISAWSSQYTFTTSSLNPTWTSIGILPNLGLKTSVTPTFTWAFVNQNPQIPVGSGAYAIQVSEDLEFENIVYSATGLSGSPHTMPLFSRLKFNQGYNWRVRFIGSLDGAWSQPLEFLTIIPKISLSSPEDGSDFVRISPTLSWVPPSSDFTYVIEISETETFDEVTFLVSPSPSLTVTNILDFGSTYYWRVTGENNEGVVTETSDIWRFTTEPIPLISPVDNAENVSIRPTLNFVANPNATSIDVVLSKNMDLTQPERMVLTVPQGQTQLEWPVELDYETIYHWGIINIIDDTFIPMSMVWSFKTINELPPTDNPDAVVKVSPANESENVDRDIRFVWRSMENITEFRIKIGLSENLGIGLYNLSVSPNDTTFKLQQLLEPETIYYWTVYTINGEDIGPEGEIWSFITSQESSNPDLPPAVILKSPANEAINLETSVTLAWYPIPDVDEYGVRISTVSDFSSTVFSFTQNSTDSTYTLPFTLLNGVSYYWYIFAKNSTGDGPIGDIWKFTTKAAAVPTPQLVTHVSPVDEETGVPKTVQFKWNTSVNSLTYQIQISREPQIATLDFTADNLSDTTYTAPSELVLNTTYYWRVRGRNDFGVGPWSEISSFTVTGVPTSIDEDVTLPAEFQLQRIYPNPFNPTTNIQYVIPNSGAVNISVFDVTGREVMKYSITNQPAGTHTTPFDGRHLTSGLYIVKLTFGGLTKTMKMTLLK